MGQDERLLEEELNDSVTTNEIGRDHHPKNSSTSAKNFLNPSDSSRSGLREEFVLYKYRWVQLAIFCSAALLNQVAWISLQPIAQQVSDAYNQSNTVVNTISLVYQGVFIVFTFPSNYAIDIYGCRKAVLLGTFLTALGMGIKCFINQSFYICIAGQVFAAIGQPFLVNAPTKLAAVWFGPNERVIAVTIAVAAQALGAAVGFVFPSIFVSPDD